ncbi:MAG TPA: helix-turn-helix transcriptional regulator [Bacillota bacterium]|nr:helix-turn-helix transcriptional regulator [Bacillota bacterium]
MDVKQIGRRIKGFRKLKGYTQEEFAKRMQVSVYMLSSIEQGKRKLSDEQTEHVCHLLQISENELIGPKKRSEGQETSSG